jgi:hypothetical protein
MLDQIEEQVNKTAKQKLNAYRDNLNKQFRDITPWRREHRQVIGNMGGEDNIFEWRVETFFEIYDNVDPIGSEGMRGDEYEMAEAWGAWRFIYHLLSAFIEGLPEDAKAQRYIFKRMPVGQALINVILLSTHKAHGAYKSKESLISDTRYEMPKEVQNDSGFRDSPITMLLARGDQAGSGCSLLGHGYLEEDLLHLFKDRTIKDMIRGVPSGKEESVTITGNGLQVQ